MCADDARIKYADNDFKEIYERSWLTLLST